MILVEPDDQTFPRSAVMTRPLGGGDDICVPSTSLPPMERFVLGPSGEMTTVWSDSCRDEAARSLQGLQCSPGQCTPQAGLSITSARQVRFANGSWTRKYKVKRKGGKYRRVPHFRFRVNLRASGNTVVEQVGIRTRSGKGKWSGLQRPSGQASLCRLACLLPSHNGYLNLSIPRPPLRKFSYPYRFRVSSSNAGSLTRTLKVRPSGVR